MGNYNVTSILNKGLQNSFACQLEKGNHLKKTLFKTCHGWYFML